MTRYVLYVIGAVLAASIVGSVIYIKMFWQQTLPVRLLCIAALVWGLACVVWFDYEGWANRIQKLTSKVNH